MTPARAAALAIAGASALFAVSVGVVAAARRAVSARPIYGSLPDFTLTERDGSTLTRPDLLGRVHVVDFVFTRCPDSCPRMGGELQTLYRAFAGSDAVRLVSVTVDPEHDTPEVLRDYAQRLGVTDRRWLFLTGPLPAVQELSERGFLLGARDLPGGHSTRLVLLDRAARIRGYYDAFDPLARKVLKSHIRELVRES